MVEEMIRCAGFASSNLTVQQTQQASVDESVLETVQVLPSAPGPLNPPIRSMDTGLSDHGRQWEPLKQGPPTVSETEFLHMEHSVEDENCTEDRPDSDPVNDSSMQPVPHHVRLACASSMVTRLTIQ